MDKPNIVYPMEYFFSQVKEVSVGAETELTFEHVILDERSQTPEATYCIIPLFQISRIQKFIET